MEKCTAVFLRTFPDGRSGFDATGTADVNDFFSFFWWGFRKK